MKVGGVSRKFPCGSAMSLVMSCPQFDQTRFEAPPGILQFHPPAVAVALSSACTYLRFQDFQEEISMNQLILHLIFQIHQLRSVQFEIQNHMN